MKQLLRLDGTLYHLAEDERGLHIAEDNGGGSQSFHDEGIQPVMQPTELGETLKELNKDDLEEHTRMSGIDMRARLHPVEVSNLLALDALVALQVLPTTCLAFSRQKKRLSVSHKGMGRKEIVDLVGGKKEQDIKAGTGGFSDKMKGMFGMR